MAAASFSRVGASIFTLGAFAALACSRGAETQGATGAPAKPAAVNASAADADRPADTLSRLSTLPTLYDGDTTNLLPRWAEKLENGTKDGVIFAIERLGAARDAGVPEIARVVDRNLKDPGRFAVLVNCADALGASRSRSDQSLELLGKILRSSSGTARTTAASALGLVGDARAFPMLRDRFAESTDPFERAAIVKALATVEGPETGAFLAEILEKPQPAAVSIAAAKGLAVRPIAETGPFLRTFLESPPPIRDIVTPPLAASGDAAGVAAARRIGADPGNLYRGEAIAGLARGGDLEPALAALRDEDPKTRLEVGVSAILGLVREKPPEGEARARIVAALRARNDDPSPAVRIHALRILRSLGETLPVERDLEALESDDAPRVAAALDVVTDLEIADPRATPIVAKRLRAAPFERKTGFAQALGRLRDPAGVPPLEELLAPPSPVVEGIVFCDYAAIQLANLRGPGLDALVRAFDRSTSPARRVALVRAISGSDDARAREKLRAIAGSEKDDPEVRAAAIRALPKVDRDGAASVLKRCLATEKDPRVRNLLNATLFELY